MGTARKTNTVVVIASGGAILVVGAILFSYPRHARSTALRTIPVVPAASKIISTSDRSVVHDDQVDRGFQLLVGIAGKAKPELVEYLRNLSSEERISLLRRVLMNSQGPARSQQLHDLFSAWATIDPLEALRSAHTLTTPTERELAAIDIFNEAPATKASALLKELDNDREISPRLYQTLASKALTKLSKINAEAATSYIDAHPDAKFDIMTVSEVASDLGKTKGRAAMDWAATQTGQYGNIALQGGIAGWGSNDLAGATSYVRNISDLTLRAQLGGMLANRLALKDPAAAIEWSRQVDNPAERAAINMSIAGATAYQDPKKAADWALSLPPEERTDAVSVVASEWAKKNSEQTAGWIQSLPAGPDRDAAVSSFSYALQTGSPEEALSWSLQISDPSRRTDTFMNLYRSWKSRDPLNAGEWLRTAPMPSDLKDYIQKTNSNGY